MEVTGWGRFPKITAEIFEPADSQSLQKFLSSQNKSSKCISRGAGRSYGDSSLAAQLLSSRFLDNFLDLDEDRKTVRCGSGISLGDILKVCIPRGLFLNVLPGTKQVSLGGAIAADVHGKNHHRDGSFCDSVESISLVLASGELVSCSRNENADLFRSTCAGMGLTGVIVDATLTLQKISSTYIKQECLVANNLQESFDLIEANNDSMYSVAWLDCLSQGQELGRSLLYLGEHAEANNRKTDLKFRSRRGLSVPFSTPAFLLNKTTMTLFNNSYFALKKNSSGQSILDYDNYFFPLDNIRNWNRLYGAKGFLQYQFVMPSNSALEGMAAVLKKVADLGMGSFLTVLKKFGEENENLLSFPKQGYTLTLDFKQQPSLFPLLEELDQIVLDHSGRIYLAKDARMSETVFKACYPNWEEFVNIKCKYDPNGRFASLQSDRLGLS